MEQPTQKENRRRSSVRFIGLLLGGIALGAVATVLLQPRLGALKETNRALEALAESQGQQILQLESDLEGYKTRADTASKSDAKISLLEEELAFIKSHARSLQAEAKASSLRIKQVLSLKQVLKKTRDDLEKSQSENAALREELNLISRDYKSLTHPSGIAGPKLLRDSHLIRINELSEYFDGALTLAVTKIGLETASLRINSDEETHALGVGQMLELELDQKRYGFRLDRLRHDSFIYLSVLLLDI